VPAAIYVLYIIRRRADSRGIRSHVHERYRDVRYGTEETGERGGGRKTDRGAARDTTRTTFERQTSRSTVALASGRRRRRRRRENNKNTEPDWERERERDDNQFDSAAGGGDVIVHTRDDRTADDDVHRCI